MFDVSSNGVIKITRGDSAYLTINVADADGNPYILENEDKVRVQVRSKYNDDENEGFLFEGEVTDNGDGTVIWRIKPEDTATANPATAYYYDVQLEIGEDIFTIISSKFKILNEVTLPKSDGDISQDGD